MSPPRVPINWVDFDKLCAMQCTVLEIAEWFNCSEETIKRAVKRAKHMTFEQYAAAKRTQGHIALRRRQFEVANKGNVTMLIWLGKQWLGQRDKTETTTRDLSLEEILREVAPAKDAPSEADE